MGDRTCCMFSFDLLMLSSDVFATSCEVLLEGEGEVAFFSTKRWDRRNRADVIESTTPCHGAPVVGSYRAHSA